MEQREITSVAARRGTLKRFSWGRRIEHLVGALVFIILALTGLAQRFHTSGWANWLIGFLGGIDATRVVHRWAGLLFTALLAGHVAISVYGLLVLRWRPSMVVNRKDFSDALTNLRYYFGLCDSPARCDRFDYRQKFEYWGVILGGMLMILTGFMLWYPVQLFAWLPFLPGQVIPAAKAAHTNEAMLALLIIVVWHIYNSVFSPEVFPLDTSILTGRISRSRMLHEHPLEYERITREAARTSEAVPKVLNERPD